MLATTKHAAMLRPKQQLVASAAASPVTKHAALAAMHTRTIASALRPAPTAPTATSPSTRRSQQPTVEAAAAPRRTSVIAASAAAAPSSSAPPAWKIPVYILMWYAFNIVFNIVNKSALNAFPCPWFIATLQLGASSLFMAVLWITKIHPLPQVDKAFFLALLPVALFHTIGHVSACVSFSQMAVSFAHIVKAAEPVLSVALSGPLLGVQYPAYVWLSLLPIVAGCSLSAMKEVSFAWSGFNNAMISNIGMVLRNIYSKKSLVNYKHIDGINLFGLISIVSLLYCIPSAYVLEGAMWGPAWEAAVLKLGAVPFYQLLAWGGLFYHLYNQASYMVLNQGVSPVTFSVGNTMKRVAVVVSSVIFFKNPVGMLNWAGSSIAILGTYLYTVASDKFAEEQKAAKAKEAK